MEWMNRLRATRGRVGFWAKPLDGEATGFNEDLPLVAASVVKVPVMVEAFRQFRAGLLDPDEQVTIRPEDRMPSCGALTYLSDKVRPTLMDLTTLMIILSDNTAANLMIDRVGVDAVNRTMEERGVPGICLRRKFFQPQLAALGVTNTVTARGCGVLLEKMAKGELLGGEDDARMLSILYNQRLNGKIPFFLHGVKIAHKTGEDDGTTHDAALIQAKRPFVLCMLSNDVDVPEYERLMQDAARELYEMYNR